MVRLLAALSALLLLAGACGDDDAGIDAGASSTTTQSTTSTTEAATTTTTSGELPGEVIDIFPYEDATVAVVGVRADDVLNVRTRPGVDFDVVYTLAPTGQATATGVNRQLDSGEIWAQISHDGETGWANTAFLLQPGQTTDETSALYPSPSDLPSAETLVDLAGIVADRVGSEEPRSNVTIVDGPSVGDLGEVTVDVIGLGDDAIGGYRLHLFAQPDSGGESFTLKSVEQTVLCSRGVTDEGICA